MAKQITYAADRKISDNNYGSFGFHISITMDVEEGELGKKTEQAVKYVEAVLAKKVKQVDQYSLPYDTRDKYDPTLEGEEYE